MGTRSTYRFIETYRDAEGKVKENKIALVYFQFDGYPGGHPMEAAEWLASGKVVNGLSGEEGLQFNGIECLTAQFIWKFKEGKPGGVYVQPLNTRGKSWENYLYDIIVDFDTKSIKMVAYENLSRPKKIFEGTPAEFVAHFSKEENQ